MICGEKIVVKGREIGNGAPIFLTAEIGSAHNGSVESAKEMMLGAKQAGCDGADMFMSSSRDFYYADNGLADRDMRDIVAEFEFTEAGWAEIFRYGDEIGLITYVTPLDIPSVEMAGRLGIPMVNVNSDDANNPGLLRKIAGLGVPVTMHDINANLSEMELAVRTLRDAGCSRIILLHSTLESGEEDNLYATANLRVMDTYKAAFGGMGVHVGCVEHTTSDFLIYAVAAREPALISKHILLAHDPETPDDSISVDLGNLKTMVRNVRYVEMALGGGHNLQVVNQAGEIGAWDVARRKVLVAARDISEGAIIAPDDIVAKRPGNRGGLHPSVEFYIVGARASRSIEKDEKLSLSMFSDFQENGYKNPALELFRSTGRKAGP